MKRSLLICLAATLSASITLAADDAGLPGEFLNAGAGARPQSMGRAFTAVADDIDALFWNPAGLATYRSSQLEFQHSPLPLKGAQDYFAYSQPLYAYGSLGVGILNVGSPSIPRVDDTNTEIGTFDHRETGYIVGYGQKIRERLAVGGNVKLAQISIDGHSQSGFGADAGALYTANNRFKLGAMLRNALAPTYGFETEEERFPRVLRTGASMNFLNEHLTTAFDLEKTIGTRQHMRPSLGLEGYVIRNIMLRAGVNQSEISAGIGLRWRNLMFDYGGGFQDIGFVNRFTLKLLFGGYEVDVKASPEVFSPVGLTNKVTFRLYTNHRERIVKWIFTIRNAKGEVVHSFQGYDAPPAVLEWDGHDTQGRVVEEGRYEYRLMTTDSKNQTEKTPARSLRVLTPTPFEIEAK